MKSYTRLPTDTCDCDEMLEAIVDNHDAKCKIWDDPLLTTYFPNVRYNPWSGNVEYWEPADGDIEDFYEGSLLEFVEEVDDEKVEKQQTTFFSKPECTCEPERTYFCGKCGVERKGDQHEWEWLSDDDEWWGGGSWGYGGGFGGVTGAVHQKCRHWREPITLPSGTVIHCSSESYHGDKTKAPDIHFGAYLYSGWQPSNLGFLVAWQDYGLPKCNWDGVIYAAQELLRLAREGSNVEIGCMGGHGRTGAMLAVIAVCDGMKAEESVEWVRKTYCNHAIETIDQEWFPLWVEAKLQNLPLPSPPEKPKPKPYVKPEEVAKKVVTPMPNKTGVTVDARTGKKNKKKAGVQTHGPATIPGPTPLQSITKALKELGHKAVSESNKPGEDPRRVYP